MSRLVQLEQSLTLARNPAELNLSLENYLLQHKIDTFAFTYYSYVPTSLNKLKFDFASAKYKAWHQHFVEEGYDDVDTTLDEVYKTTIPICWNLAEQLANVKSKREKTMRKDSIAYGIEKGISIPIHGPQEDFAILVVIQLKGQTCLQNIQELQFELFTAAYFYYHYLQKVLLQSHIENKQYKLNKREIQCLTLLVKEYSLKEMAKKLNLTERTVNHYIQRINKKFGTKNKYQSIIRALSKGIISI